MLELITVIPEAVEVGMLEADRLPGPAPPRLSRCLLQDIDDANRVAEGQVRARNFRGIVKGRGDRIESANFLP